MSAKGSTWSHHKYKAIVNGRYVYDDENQNTNDDKMNFINGLKNFDAKKTTQKLANNIVEKETKKRTKQIEDEMYGIKGFKDAVSLAKRNYDETGYDKTVKLIKNAPATDNIDEILDYVNKNNMTRVSDIETFIMAAYGKKYVNEYRQKAANFVNDRYIDVGKGIYNISKKIDDMKPKKIYSARSKGISQESMNKREEMRNRLKHSAKGTSWKHHKYKAVKNGRYIYDEKPNTGSDDHDTVKELGEKLLRGTVDSYANTFSKKNNQSRLYKVLGNAESKYKQHVNDSRQKKANREAYNKIKNSTKSNPFVDAYNNKKKQENYEKNKRINDQRVYEIRKKESDNRYAAAKEKIDGYKKNRSGIAIFKTALSMMSEDIINKGKNYIDNLFGKKPKTSKTSKKSKYSFNNVETWDNSPNVKRW